MRRTQIQLDEQTYEALRKKAFQERRSMSDLIREAAQKSIDTKREARGKAGADKELIEWTDRFIKEYRPALESLAKK